MSWSESRTEAIATLTARANAVFRDRKSDAARPLYRDLSVAVLLRSAECAREQKDLFVALKTVNTAIDIDPNSADAHSARAGIYHEMSDFKRAEVEYSESIRLIRSAPAFASEQFLALQYWLRGKSITALKDYVRAESDYKSALQFVPSQSSRTAVRCQQEMSLHRTVNLLNPKALMPLSSFPCSAAGCKCSNAELFPASNFCGECDHPIDAHRAPSASELREHQNALTVYSEEMIQSSAESTGVAARVAKAIAASVKYATYHYLNYSDVLSNGFNDPGRSPLPRHNSGGSGSSVVSRVPIREVLTVDIRDDMWLADCLRRALNAITIVPAGDERALELGRFVSHALGGAASDISKRCDEYLESIRPAAVQSPAAKRVPPSPAARADVKSVDLAEVRVSASMGDFIRLQIGACRHRAILYKYLADYCGVECRLIRGSVQWSNGGGGAHAWIIVNKRKPKLIDLTASTVELLDPQSPAGHNYRRHGTTTHSPGAHSVPPFHTIPTPYHEFGAMELLSDRDLSRVRRTVWRGRQVVIKELKPSGNPKAETYDIRGFMREAGIMSDFRHPNVVQLIAACDNRQPFRPPQSPSPPPQSQHSPKSPAVRTGNTTSGGGATANAAAGSGGGGSGAAAAAVPHDAASSARFAIILEFIPGGSLRDYVSERHSTLSMSERIGLLVQCAEPLSEMHAVEIVHRDIKPDNIMLTTDKPPHVKLCDFGLARYVSPGDAIVSTVRPNAGTPHFMAPEQAAGDPLTPAIDAYAFGGLIFFMLYGKQPWIDRHSMQILMALIRKEKPPVPSGVVLPPQVASPSAAAATATATTRVDSKINASAPTATADSFQSALFLNLEHLMRRCYEYEPKARPTMREIVDELRDLYDLSLNPNPLPVMSASVAAAAPTPNAAVILTLPVATATVVTPIARSTAPAVYASAAVIAPPAAATPAVYNPYAYNPHASASAVTVVVVTPSAEANSLYPASIGVEGQPDEYPPAVFDHHSS